MKIHDIISSGEKIQQIANVYLGENFNYNPVISIQTHNHVYINSISSNYDNPKIVFLYSDYLTILCKKIHFFKNKFILITHNSDVNIENNQITNRLLNNFKIDKWYAQNVCFEHPKLIPLPIGMANTMWPHGDLTYFNNLEIEQFKKLHLFKSEKIYFNFNISTNPHKRNICYNSISKKIKFLDTINPYDNLERLSKYEFCICPEGNGVDTHRLWEAIYLQTVPIVLKTPFILILQQKYNFNMVLLDSWDLFDETKLNYRDYTFDDEYFNNISFSKILHEIKEK